MMRYEIAESVLHEYNAGEPGITVPARLTAGTAVQNVITKLDTGAAIVSFDVASVKL
jgi:hypothetical protein